jgi:hypothetical protein
MPAGHVYAGEVLVELTGEGPLNINMLSFERIGIFLEGFEASGLLGWLQLFA